MAANSLCANLKGIRQDINAASKLFYSYCCSFYECQLWDLSRNCIEDIYVALQKTIRCIFSLPYNTYRYLLPVVAGSSCIWVNLVKGLNNFFNALMSSYTKIIGLGTTAISVILNYVSTENSWICAIVIDTMKLKKLMGHCFCRYWMFDVQIGLSLSFRKNRLNVCFMMFVSIDLVILWWCIF